jgi:hypothetical protein
MLFRVLLGNAVPVAGRNHRVDFVEEPRLHLRLPHQVRHNPLKRGHRRVDARGQELRAEAHHLGVGERALAFLPGQLVGQERVDVAVRQALVVFSSIIGHAASSISSCSDQWQEQLLLPPTNGEHLLPPPPEHPLGDRRAEGEHLEADVRREELPLHGLDLPDAAAVQPPAEAHVREQREHGELETLHDGHLATVLLAPVPEVGDQSRQIPPPRGSEKRDARRVEDAGGEVPPQRPPERAVGRGADGALAAVEHAEGRDGGRAAGEGRPALDERAVGDAAAGDEDGGARGEEAEREDRAVPPVQLPDGRLEAVARAHEAEERARDGHCGRGRRQREDAAGSGLGRLHCGEQEEDHGHGAADEWEEQEVCDGGPHCRLSCVLSGDHGPLRVLHRWSCNRIGLCTGSTARLSQRVVDTREIFAIKRLWRRGFTATEIQNRARWQGTETGIDSLVWHRKRLIPVSLFFLPHGQIFLTLPSFTLSRPSYILARHYAPVTFEIDLWRIHSARRRSHAAAQRSAPPPPVVSGRLPGDRPRPGCPALGPAPARRERPAARCLAPPIDTARLPGRPVLGACPSLAPGRLALGPASSPPVATG